MVDPHTLERAARAALDAEEYLRRNDSADFFERAGGLLGDGPTGTNVNDFRAILVNPPAADTRDRHPGIRAANIRGRG
ncbi:MAG: MOFRL family protein [Lysobacterales bacterium]